MKGTKGSTYISLVLAMICTMVAAGSIGKTEVAEMQPTAAPDQTEAISTMSYMQYATPSKESETVKPTPEAETVSTAESAEAASTDTPTPAATTVKPTVTAKETATPAETSLPPSVAKPTVTVKPSPSQAKPSPSPSTKPKSTAGLTEGKSYTMTIYHYCACRKCTPGTGITASGKRVVVGMVAMHGLPFGTVVEFNGRQYTVEDRGVGAYKVDVYVEDHEEAIQKGMYKAEVKIVRMGVIEND